MSNFEIFEDSQPEINDAIDLYVSVGWGTRKDYNPEGLKKAFDNSNFMTAYSHGKLVGLVRIISDGYQDTYLTEFLVHPDYQGKGIGRSLMEKTVKNYGRTDIYGDTPEKYLDFFTRCGMKPQTFLRGYSRKAA